MTFASKSAFGLSLALALVIGCGDGLAVSTDDDERQEVDATDRAPTTAPQTSSRADAAARDAGRDAGMRDGSSRAAPSTDDDAVAPSDAGGDAPEVEADDAGTTTDTARALPAVSSVEAAGPFAVTIDQNVGPNRGWIARPTDLGKDGIEHPVFIWGAGAGTNASNYKDHLTRWASHGFVVEGHASTGSERDHKGALDFLIAENGRQGSPYYQKLDVTKVAFGGHSQGSISTFAAAGDPRITTTIHVAGGAFDGNGGSKLKKPAAFVCGEADTGATGNSERDYTGTKTPVFMTVMDNVNHIYAAREGLPATTAWLRWHLAGEVERKAQFIGDSCEFCKGKYVSKSKNW